MMEIFFSVLLVGILVCSFGLGFYCGQIYTMQRIKEISKKYFDDNMENITKQVIIDAHHLDPNSREP